MQGSLSTVNNTADWKPDIITPVCLMCARSFCVLRLYDVHADALSCITPCILSWFIFVKLLPVVQHWILQWRPLYFSLYFELCSLSLSLNQKIKSLVLWSHCDRSSFQTATLISFTFPSPPGPKRPANFLTVEWS